jgi:outer membrane protein assembly factor BamB
MNPGEGERRGRRVRGWFPILVIGLAAVVVAALDASSWWLRAYVSALVVALATALAVGWAIAVLAPTRRARTAGLVTWAGLLVVAGILAPRVFRVTGAGGSGLFEVEPVWSQPDELTALPAPGGRAPDVGVSAAAPGDPAFAEASYPQFLGPARDGVVPGIDFGRPDWRSQPPELVWEREVGPGWSGFVVASGRAVTHEQRGGQEVVTCYDLATGVVVWSHANEARFAESMSGVGPRACPTIDGDLVFAAGATGILDCLKLGSGALVWSRRVCDPDRNIEWGKSSAPLVVDGLVVATGGRSPGPALLAFRREAGEPAWQSGDWGASYSSPVVATLAGRRQVVAVHADRVAGHDPAGGAVLWEFAWPGGYPRVGQPVVVGADRLLVTAGYGQGATLIEVRPSGEGFRAREVWHSNKLKTKFSSAVVRGGFAYGLDEGRLACIDLADGSRVWRGEKFGYGQNLLAGDLLLVQAESGDVALVAASPERFEEVTRFPALAGKSWNPPALAGDFLVVRNAGRAACYRWR